MIKTNLPPAAEAELSLRKLGEALRKSGVDLPGAEPPKRLEGWLLKEQMPRLTKKSPFLRKLEKQQAEAAAPRASGNVTPLPRSKRTL